jgi:hypothetical protein
MLVNRSYILDIIYGFLAHCGDNFGAMPGIWTASYVTTELQDLVILGIILFFLTPYVFWKADGIRSTKVARYAKNANISIMAIIVAVFVPFVVITSIGEYRIWSGTLLANSTLDLPAAYFFLLLCAAVHGAAVLLLFVAFPGEGITTVL